MLIGHYAVGLVAKRFIPRASLGLLICASTFPDLLWAACLVLRLEPLDANIAREVLPPIAFSVSGTSHGLITILITAILFSVGYWRVNLQRQSLLLGLLVVCHWLLDALSRSGSMPIYGRHAIELGFGSPYFWTVLEGVLVVSGIVLYLFQTHASDRVGRWGFLCLAGIIVAGYISELSGLTPYRHEMIGGLTVLFFLLPICFAWIDEHRMERDERHEISDSFAKIASIFRKTHAPEARQRASQTEKRGISAPIRTERSDHLDFGVTEPPEFEAEPGLRRNIKATVGRSVKGLLFALVLLVAVVFTATSHRVVSNLLNHAFVVQRADTSARSENREKLSEIAVEKAISNHPAALQPELQIYSSLSADLRSILRDELESKRVSGFIAVLATNWQCNRNRWIFRTPEQLGLHRIEDKESFVKLVEKGDLKIAYLNLARDAGNAFKISMEVVNDGNKAVSCVSPKGQVFELQAQYFRAADRQQVLVDPEQKRWKFPRGRTTISFLALCMNQGLAPPEGPGNIAIYQLANTDFPYDPSDKSQRNQNELHRSVNKALSCGG